ncbi:MAG: hypothetical protein RSD27_01015, partial [Ruthenibacterium sp.]
GELGGRLQRTLTYSAFERGFMKPQSAIATGKKSHYLPRKAIPCARPEAMHRCDVRAHYFCCMNAIAKQSADAPPTAAD